MDKKKIVNEELLKRLNILIMNLKGGVGKTTNASIIASYYMGSTLIEVDKINESDKRIKSPYYDSIQMDFTSSTSENWLVFEEKLLEDGVKIIDVGAVKLETFHEAMQTNQGYDVIDLIVIPATRGVDDLILAIKFLANLKASNFDTKKVIFAFNMYNESEYSIQEQFKKFFRNKKMFLKEYGINLDDEKSYYVLPDKKSIDYARDIGITVRELASDDEQKLREKYIGEITKEEIQKYKKDDKELEDCNDEEIKKIIKRNYLERKNCVNNAKNLYVNYLLPMITKINEIVQPKKEEVKSDG